MNVCKNCGNEYEGTYCPECGVKFDLLRVCKSCGTAFSGKYCPECGERFLPLQTCANCGNRFVGRFCPECGAEYVSINSCMDSGDVTLSGYGAENSGVDVVPTSLLGCDEMSFEEKEKNVLGYVESLIERGLFKEAAKWLDEIEKEEIALRGKVSAAIYYYKIFCENMTSSPDEVAEKYTDAGIDLKNNTNYILAMSSDDSPEKTKIIELDKKVEGVLRDRELYRQAEEKRKKEDEERKAREQREAAERIERERREAAEAKRREEEERLGLISSEGLEFEERGDGYIFTWVGTCNDTDIVIPSTFRGRPVTGVGEGALIGCKHIKSVVLPKSVTSISKNAFAGCSSLTKIVFPEALTSIGEGAFSECSSLTQINIPDNVVEIGASAFDSCRNLKCIKIPDGVTVIRDKTFYFCETLTDLTLSKNISSIGKNAFSECKKLNRLFLPDKLKKISDYAFDSCYYLKYYYLGSADAWKKISIGSWGNYPLTRSSKGLYFFSESRPRTLGQFWHYDEKGNLVEW